MLTYEDDLWDFLEFSATETFVLRSFLENIVLRNDTPETKLELLSNWRRAVGLQLGNTVVFDSGIEALRKARGLPPQEKHEFLQRWLAAARDRYFFGS